MSSVDPSTSLLLSNGQQMPSVGLGLWKLPKPIAGNLVETAIETGYRHLDSACDYGNEKEVGAGIRRALARGICRRDDLWVTSKLWNTYHAPEHVEPALKRTLSDLQLDYLDLYHIHFPISLQFVPFETRYPPEWLFDPTADAPKMLEHPVPIKETWQAMEELVDKGLVKSIGVCNFGVSLLRDLLSNCRHRPQVLQIELHPYLTQETLVRYCIEQHIAVTGFSPLGALSYVSLSAATAKDSVLLEPAIISASQRLSKTPAQVVLRWAIQRGTSIVPMTTKPERLKENLSLFDFQLSESEMTDISSLNRNRRYNDPGEFCETAFNTFFPIYE